MKNGILKFSLKRLERILWVRPLWLLNFWVCKTYWRLASGRSRNPQFLKERHITGVFLRRDTDALITALQNTPTYEGFAANPLKSYVYDDSQGKRDRDYNRGRKFFKLHPGHLELVKQLLEQIAGQIEEAAGFYWRVANVFASRESDTDKPNGDREWHYDRFAHGAFKVLVYLTGASEERGTTEVAPGGERGNFLIEGPPGTWMFFDNNALRHRAVVAQEGVRYLLQVTIAPSLRTHAEPAHVPDGQYPKLPWKPAPPPALRALSPS